MGRKGEREGGGWEDREGERERERERERDVYSNIMGEIGKMSLGERRN